MANFTTKEINNRVDYYRKYFNNKESYNKYTLLGLIIDGEKLRLSLDDLTVINGYEYICDKCGTEYYKSDDECPKCADVGNYTLVEDSFKHTFVIDNKLMFFLISYTDECILQDYTMDVILWCTNPNEPMRYIENDEV